MDLAEKYLYEYDYVNPFYCLMFEGLFGFLLTFIFFAFPDYLHDIKLVYNTYSAGYLVLFTFLLLLYIILSGGRNAFKVITTKIYSPTTRGLADYLINPFYLIFDFCLGNDFIKQGERNIPYFVINLIISIIISFFGCVYNDFIVLFCCGLEKNTHVQISRKSTFIQNELIDFGNDFESSYDDELSNI